jgi:6-pyruvoyltetrahydropterin/6-carboxytetrahydropterin synthase
MPNGEREVRLDSIIVHETDTGYAQAFEEDAHSKLMGEINLKEITFSKQVKSEWKDPKLWEKLCAFEKIENPLKV